MFVIRLVFTYTIYMRTLALFLSIGAISLSGASGDISSLFPNYISSAVTVIQCQATGAIEYYAETRLSPSGVGQIDDFEDYLKSYGLPIDKKDETIGVLKQISNDDYYGHEITFDYKVTYKLETAVINNMNYIQLTISFNNFCSWLKFHNHELNIAKGDESLFFVHYTTKFNPYDRFFDSAGTSGKTAGIINKFVEEFDDTTRPGYLYVLTNSPRRTKTNAAKVETQMGNYTYYFTIPTSLDGEVDIFDRYPNTPIWYGLAVAATAVTMVTFYLIVRRRPNRQEPKI